MLALGPGECQHRWRENPGLDPGGAPNMGATAGLSRGAALRIGPAPQVGAAARRVQVIRPCFRQGSPAGVRGGRVRVRPGTNVPRRRPAAGASSLISSPGAPAPAWTRPGGLEWADGGTSASAPLHTIGPSRARPVRPNPIRPGEDVATHHRSRACCAALASPASGNPTGPRSNLEAEPCWGWQALRRNRGGGFRLHAEAGGHSPRGPDGPGAARRPRRQTARQTALGRDSEAGPSAGRQPPRGSTASTAIALPAVATKCTGIERARDRPGWTGRGLRLSPPPAAPASPSPLP